MRIIPLLRIVVVCILILPSCKFDSSKALSKKEIEKIQKQKRLEAIKKQLNTSESCSICDSTEVFKSLEDFLALERFDGKVIYLDFWGTGCKPCIEEFAYLPELKKEFENEPLEYVYVTTYGTNKLNDFKIKTWEQIIEKHKLTGINVLISNEAKVRFYQRHRNIVDPGWANIIPVYLLFNKQGTIVNYVAPRPSSKELLYAEIRELLDKE